MTWGFLFPDSDIKAEMVLPPWNNFLRSLLHFIVIRSGHDDGLERISFESIFLILRWQEEEKGRHQKEEVSQPPYMNVGRRSLDICSQVFYRLFACAVIHTAKRCTGWF
jgi:hypothetical protein